MVVTKLGLLAEALADAQRKFGELNFITNSSKIYRVVVEHFAQIPTYSKAIASLGITSAVSLRRFMSQHKDEVLEEENARKLNVIVPEFKPKVEHKKRYIPTEDEIEFINQFIADKKILYDTLDKTLFEDDIDTNGWNPENVWVGRNPDEDLPAMFIHISDDIDPNIARKIFEALRHQGYDKFIYQEWLDKELGTKANVFKVSFMNYDKWVKAGRPDRIIDGRQDNSGKPRDLLKNKGGYIKTMHESYNRKKRITVLNESERTDGIITNIWNDVKLITDGDLDLSRYYVEWNIDPVEILDEDSTTSAPVLREVTSICATDDERVELCLGDTVGICKDIRECNETEIETIAYVVGIIADEIRLRNAEVYTLEDIDESMKYWKKNRLNEEEEEQNNNVPANTQQKVVDLSDEVGVLEYVGEAFCRENYARGSISDSGIDVDIDIFPENFEDDNLPLILSVELPIKKIEPWWDSDEMGRRSATYYDITWNTKNAKVSIYTADRQSVPFINQEYLFDKLEYYFEDEWSEIAEYSDYYN